MLFVTVLQHPKEQCVLVGSNASFSCSARDSRSSTITTHWLVRFSNASEYEILHENDQADVHIHNHQPVQGTREYSSSLTVVISHSNMLRWNSAHFLCDFHGSKRFQSDIAILAIYTSLSK